MKTSGNSLQKPYQLALRRYVQQPSPNATLLPALTLGRRAVTLGLDTLDLALIHERALVKSLESSSTESGISRTTLKRRARKFFSNTLLPLEASHHAAIESKVRLAQLDRDLKTSNRALVKETRRRKTAEASLVESKILSASHLEDSRSLQEQMRFLSRQVLTAQEDERKRISRELHDVIGQMLMGINVQLAILKSEAVVNTRGLTRKISSTQRLVEKSVNVVHRFARELRPAVLDDLGLIPAIHSYLKEFSNETGIRATLTAFKGIEKMGSTQRTTLYRVAQEALANVGRHAQASRVDVIIQKLQDTVSMQIRDDGKSFDVSRMWHAKKSQRLGMLGMRERLEMVNGSFRVESSPGKGTTVFARIPFITGVKEALHP